MGMYVSVLEWGHRLGIDEVFAGPCIFDLPPKILGSLGRPGCILSNCLGKCKFIPSIVNPHVVKPPKTMEQVGWVTMHRGWIKVGTREICCACRLWITFGCLFLIQLLLIPFQCVLMFFCLSVFRYLPPRECRTFWVIPKFCACFTAVSIIRTSSIHRM